MAYKIINGHVILDSKMRPQFESQQPNRKCKEAKVGYKNQLNEPSCTLDIVKPTFFYATPKLWNHSITPNQANAPSVEAFKHYFKKK